MEFVRAGVGLPSLWEQLKGQIYLGSDEFVESLLRRADSGQALGEVPRVQRQPVPPPLAYFDRTFADPKEGMAKAYLSGGYLLKQVAEHFSAPFLYYCRCVRCLRY